MKNLKYITLFLAAIFLTSCEEVVDVDLPTAEPRLVVDASINWQLGTNGNEQKIKLSLTAGYYDTNVPKVSGATVQVTNLENNLVYDFIENPGTGEYLCTTFEPVLDATYQLTVNYEGETYTATETMMSVVPIDKIEQKNDGGFDGESIEIKVFFTDNGDTDDFYMTKYEPSYTPIPSMYVTDDKFFQGNQFSDLLISEDLESGDTLGITLYGISEQFKNYMSLLLQVSGDGGPFATAPAKVKGNVLNTTNPNNTAFGYFRLSQIDSVDYLVE